VSAPSRIALIGFMGSGKSTVGAILAKKLGYGFVDLDSLVEAEAGDSVAEIFRKKGEGAFRALETECLLKLEKREKLVIACGGGTPLQKAAEGFLRGSAATFHLEVSLEAALNRTGGSDSRPLLARNSSAVRGLYESRLPVYRSMGRSVATDGKSPEKVAEEIVSLLAAYQSSSGC
jgi:shikimate kinase